VPAARTVEKAVLGFRQSKFRTARPLRGIEVPMLIRPTPKDARRRGGAAAVECCVIMMVMVPVLIGLWEMGRVVQVEQIISNAAREGARMAAQGNTINSSGDPTQIFATVAPPNTAKTPNVKAAVMQYLSGAGLSQLTWADVDVTFTFLTPFPAGAVAGANQPYQGIKGQRFSVTVTITDTVGANGTGADKASTPLKTKVLWSSLGLVKPKFVSYTCEWQMLVDDEFTINATLPTW
jgi:Flp pilus assembly protein TadG